MAGQGNPTGPAAGTYPAGQPVPAVETLGKEDQHEYLIHSRIEIIHILQGIAARHAPVSVYISNTENFSVSTVLQVDPDAGSVVLDYTLDRHKNAELLAHANLVFVCIHNNAKIQFPGAQASEAVHEGRPAFRIPLPSFMWRFQRRSEPRFKVPRVPPLGITLNLGGVLEADAEVEDISLSGIGAVNCAPDVSLRPGDVLKHCAIVLPGAGRIDVDLRVEYARLVPTVEGALIRRIGCRFVGLPANLRRLIGHYVIDLHPDTPAA